MLIEATLTWLAIRIVISRLGSVAAEQETIGVTPPCPMLLIYFHPNHRHGLIDARIASSRCQDILHLHKLPNGGVLIPKVVIV